LHPLPAILFGERVLYLHAPLLGFGAVETSRNRCLQFYLGSASSISMQHYSVSVRLKPMVGVEEWWLTSVYGSATNADKLDFLAELNVLRQVRTGPWLLNGDFNMIYRTCNKSNNHLNRRLMGQFRRFLEEAAMKEIHLQGRLFTWSNERAHPTLMKIDSVYLQRMGGFVSLQ
jgi:endonuclease/exonuclease/phosphatase family metal-dependent hydrolase